MAKEKTKAELLQQMNEELQEKNRNLIDEIRQVKTTISSYQIDQKKLEELQKIEGEKEALKTRVDELSKVIKTQEKQIDILVAGLNDLNYATNSYFDNLNYTLKLAKDNYDKTFNNIQTELNKTMPKEESK